MSLILSMYTLKSDRQDNEVLGYVPARFAPQILLVEAIPSSALFHGSS